MAWVHWDFPGICLLVLALHGWHLHDCIPYPMIRKAEVSVSFSTILGSVDQQRGCCEVSEGKYEITLYTSCCNLNRGIYYYTTYENHRISAVDMHKENLDAAGLIRYTPVTGEQIYRQN